MRWMMRAMVAGVAVGASVAHAQMIEFRIVERMGKTVVSGPGDGELNFAIQGRALGGTPAASIAQFAFARMVIVGEPEANGTLARGIISSPDHTYSNVIGVSNVVGVGGTASQYSYLAAINVGLSGLINLSGPTFTNGPEQEIGVIVGSAAGSALLSTPGLDVDGDGNPDTWEGNGGGMPIPSQSIAPLDPVIATTYFGAAGHWVDLYRFRYTVTNIAERRLVFKLDGASGGTFSSLVFGLGGPWGAGNVRDARVTPTTAYDLVIGVGGASAGACCGVGGMCSMTLPVDCAGVFAGSSSCVPIPCLVPRTCCLDTGVCTVGDPAACAGMPGLGTACAPNPCPQPGSCCMESGACVWGFEADCQAEWTLGGVCLPNTCPPAGVCCVNATCHITIAVYCSGGTWQPGSTCVPNPCPPLGNCCAASGACVRRLQAMCTTVWTSGTSCTPNPCPPAGRCCGSLGQCTSVIQISCVGAWDSVAACTPNPCPQPGACCSASGVCSLVLELSCADVWLGSAACTTGVCAQLGGCCQGHACVVATSAGCVAVPGRKFTGAGSVCGSAANPIACCAANFNRVSGVNMQDIYDYITAWFAGNLRADFDGLDGLTVQDVFGFLNTWLAGC